MQNRRRMKIAVACLCGLLFAQGASASSAHDKAVRTMEVLTGKAAKNDMGLEAADIALRYKPELAGFNAVHEELSLNQHELDRLVGCGANCLNRDLSVKPALQSTYDRAMTEFVVESARRVRLFEDLEKEHGEAVRKLARAHASEAGWSSEDFVGRVRAEVRKLEQQ